MMIDDVAALNGPRHQSKKLEEEVQLVCCSPPPHRSLPENSGASHQLQNVGRDDNRA